MELQFKPLDPKGKTIAEKIQFKLEGLGIYRVKVKDPIVGPIISGYPLIVPTSIAISKITSREEDLALALNVESIDIRRVKGELVIFVPNEDRKVVDFKDALFWYLKDEEVAKMSIPILIGMDFQGNKAAFDLVQQPHVLIAGSTGSGKSIFESAIISALAMKLTPDELNLYIVDPKRVDLSLFDPLPHVKKVVKDINSWYQVINYLYDEVQNRNKILEAKRCRNILEYNEKFDRKMAFKVLIIDELADLIEKDNLNRQEQKMNEEVLDLKVIDAIKRLIQVSRASGIHIIACTQRTTVDVVSGTVKANFPTRISLRLPQSVDSRAILGQNGAEHLLGKGDMLIKSGDSDELRRYHAPFVNISDIETILASQERIKEALGVM